MPARTILRFSQDLEGQSVKGTTAGNSQESVFSTPAAHPIQLEMTNLMHEYPEDDRDSILSREFEDRFTDSLANTRTDNSVVSASRPQSPSNCPSSTFSKEVSVFEEDRTCEIKAFMMARHPSILNRIKSSMSTPQEQPLPPRPSAVLADFLKQPENPERHFIDTAGMVIPGVCNRYQCAYPLPHFIINWELQEPIEYSTALADHGITYSDYCRLLSAIASFLKRISREEKRDRSSRKHSVADDSSSNDTDSQDGTEVVKAAGRRNSLETWNSFKRTEHHALALSALLANITANWRARALPVMVCISSFSLFVPSRMTKAHVQVLHVPHGYIPLRQPENGVERPLSLYDPNSGTRQIDDADDPSVSMFRRRLNESPFPPHPTTITLGAALRCSKLHVDRNRPWPLWPNAIPTNKRHFLNAHVGRYGVDPFFREYMRAVFNSRAKLNSYGQWLAERDDNPYANKRLDYIKSSSNEVTQLWGRLNRTYQKKRGRSSHLRVMNRDIYEHNRKLECRKAVELGSRLRIIRFGFRHPLYPPHTPEMDGLGLTRAKYEEILGEIDQIRQSERLGEYTAWIKSAFHHRSAATAISKVSEYIREINSKGSKIIWTIERIPGVYDGVSKSGKEWEISAWNGEDPLELLLHLEKWGVIDKHLDIEDDE